jgi:hypothetical protein
MSKYIYKTYLLSVLVPTLFFAGLAIIFYNSGPVTDPFSGYAHAIWVLFFSIAIILMVISSVPLLFTLKKSVQGLLPIELIVWFAIPLIIDIFVIFGRINGSDFDIGTVSANLMFCLSLSKIVGLSVGFYCYKKKLQELGINNRW